MYLFLTHGTCFVSRYYFYCFLIIIYKLFLLLWLAWRWTKKSYTRSLARSESRLTSLCNVLGWYDFWKSLNYERWNTLKHFTLLSLFIYFFLFIIFFFIYWCILMYSSCTEFSQKWLLFIFFFCVLTKIVDVKWWRIFTKTYYYTLFSDKELLYFILDFSEFFDKSTCISVRYNKKNLLN